MRHNPLIPHRPTAPPWDPNATADGIYITDDLLIAKDYALSVAEDCKTDPIIAVIDIAELEIHEDPQAIDLLQEPYQSYKRDILDQALQIYFNSRRALKNEGATPQEVHRSLGTAYHFVMTRVTDPNFYLPPAKATYAASNYNSEKVNAAYTIFPKSKSWSLLPSFHTFYKDEAPDAILAYLDLGVDDEESPYSSNSVYINPAETYLDVDFWYYLSDFAYIAEPVQESDIAEIYALGPDEEPISLYQRAIPAQVPAYHGSGRNRLMLAIPSLLNG